MTTTTRMRWALGGCVAVALLVLPMQQTPNYNSELPAMPLTPTPALAAPVWLDRALAFPPIYILFTITLLLIGSLTYICEWIQRKTMERRIVKLNQYLFSSVERLQLWDQRQMQLEAALRQVQNATSEYNLLLWLILRRRRHAYLSGIPSNSSAADCLFEKILDDEPLITSAINA